MTKPLDDDVLRVLAFIDQAERGGAAPTVYDIDAFGSHPKPPRTPNPFQLAAMSSMRRMFADTGRLEGVSRWLEETGMISIRRPDGEVRLTPLGRAMTRSARLGESDTVLLDPNDELSYPQLARALSTSEDFLFADPYVRLEQVHQLLAHTRVARILTSEKAVDDGELEGIRALVSGQTDRTVEVRVSSNESFHDRYAMEPNGRVFMLGASLNGLQKNVTVLAPLTDPDIGRAVIDHHEQLWQEAEPVVGPLADQP